MRQDFRKNRPRDGDTIVVYDYNDDVTGIVCTYNDDNCRFGRYILKSSIYYYWESMIS